MSPREAALVHLLLLASSTYSKTETRNGCMNPALSKPRLGINLNRSASVWSSRKVIALSSELPVNRRTKFNERSMLASSICKEPSRISPAVPSQNYGRYTSVLSLFLFNHSF
jgi:hypothetical protein